MFARPAAGAALPASGDESWGQILWLPAMSAALQRCTAAEQSHATDASATVAATANSSSSSSSTSTTTTAAVTTTATTAAATTDAGNDWRRGACAISLRSHTESFAGTATTQS